MMKSISVISPFPLFPLFLRDFKNKYFRDFRAFCVTYFSCLSHLQMFILVVSFSFVFLDVESLGRSLTMNYVPRIKSAPWF